MLVFGIVLLILGYNDFSFETSDDFNSTNEGVWFLIAGVLVAAFGFHFLMDRRR